MNVVDFLPVAIVDYQAEMVLYTKFFGDDFDCVIQNLDNLRRRLEKISMLFFGNNQQMHGVDGSMIRDDNHPVSLVEDLCGQFPIDYASEY